MLKEKEELLLNVLKNMTNALLDYCAFLGYPCVDVKYDSILCKDEYFDLVNSNDNKADKFNQVIGLKGLKANITKGFYLPFIISKEDGFLFLHQGFHRHFVSKDLFEEIPCIIIPKAEIINFLSGYKRFVYHIQKIAFDLEHECSISWHHNKLRGKLK